MTRENKFVAWFALWSAVVVIGFVLVLFFTETGSDNPDVTAAATTALWIIGGLAGAYKFDSKQRPKGAVPRKPTKS